MSGLQRLADLAGADAMSERTRIPRDFRTLAHAALKAGWDIRVLGNGHLRWRAPDGYWVYSSSSPSDWRAPHKLRAALRRAGLLLH